MSEFQEYLTDKKIDPVKFKSSEPDRYLEFENIFSQVSQTSFTAQKLFLINSLRRKYLLEESLPEEVKTVKKIVKPKISPRIKK